MRYDSSGIVLSATDLANFLACRHRTALDLAVALGKRQRPHRPEDPQLEILIQRGKDHEQAYVSTLAAQGLRVAQAPADPDRTRAIARTIAEMRAGTDVIVQAALGDERWFGYADILQRIATPSELGPWSYEVTDTKLSRETRGGTIFQLGLYSELVAGIQQARPARFHVVTPDAVAPVASYRTEDFAAYGRLIRQRMLTAVDAGDQPLAQANYPEPVEHCGVCHWYSVCREKRIADDHLSLVAGITRIQRRELESQSMPTLTSLAQSAQPLAFRPERGSITTYARVQFQAQTQLASRGTSVPVYLLRDAVKDQGLERLPEPSEGDVFLDLEGDPFAAEGGREYLIGLICRGADGVEQYSSWWAVSAREERVAFESVMDFIQARERAYPDMHVYHYAPYEPSAFKRLMGRYATRERELDAMLRSRRFVDLYAVVRQALIVGVEQYSIKNLEPLYSFTRDVDLRVASRALRSIEHLLELGRFDVVPTDVRHAVAGYNRDDCLSTSRLRDWLEMVRTQALASGRAVPRPTTDDGPAPDKVDERGQIVQEMRARLLAGIPESFDECTTEQRGLWVLAYLLDWHRREGKASWWEYFRLRDLPEEDLMDEPKAIAGLAFLERVLVKTSKKGKATGSVVDRYGYPPQEMEIGAGDELKLKEGTFGKVAAVDRERRYVDVEKGPKRAEEHPSAAFAHEFVSPDVLESAIQDIASAALASGGLTISTGHPHRAARDLLQRHAPRLRSEGSRFDGSVPSVDAAKRSVLQLDDSVLAIQGPPGAGKTFTAAQMILAANGAGLRVGVTANSHKVIRNLLDAVHRAASEANVKVALGHRMSDDFDSPAHIRVATENPDALEMLAGGQVNVLGGTAYLWARPEFEGTVDVMFVDEAGQMALANAVALSRAAKSVVLLGDPQQLEQPIQGMHPEHVGVSALEHLLGDRQTIPPDLGLFLPETWRMAPEICAFTSEQFYEGKLSSRPELTDQAIHGAGELTGTGLRLVEVTHEGNRNYSDEEVDVVSALVDRLTATGAEWSDGKSQRRPITGADVLVVSPYNAQVSRLAERLAGRGVQVGTVDKFQGREAPVVIYSMATSRPEDAPRGMQFLYSRNRLNVATSRARCLAILVASPRLFEPECQSPWQMKLANAMCRFREMSSALAITST